MAELLIVVAIIAVLVAIAIPVFTSQLERSREATDLSNIRAAYTEVISVYLSSGANKRCSVTVDDIKQRKEGWIIENPKLNTFFNGEEKAVPIPWIVKGDVVHVVITEDGDLRVNR